MFKLPINQKESEIMKTIEFLRNEMIRVGIQEGLTSENTIQISQTLDSFIAKYQSLEGPNLLT